MNKLQWNKGALTPGGGQVWHKGDRGLIIYRHRIRLGTFPNGGSFLPDVERSRASTTTKHNPLTSDQPEKDNG